MRTLNRALKSGNPRNPKSSPTANNPFEHLVPRKEYITCANRPIVCLPMNKRVEMMFLNMAQNNPTKAAHVELLSKIVRDHITQGTLANHKTVERYDDNVLDVEEHDMLMLLRLASYGDKVSFNAKCTLKACQHMNESEVSILSFPRFMLENPNNPNDPARAVNEELSEILLGDGMVGDKPYDALEWTQTKWLPAFAHPDYIAPLPAESFEWRAEEEFGSDLVIHVRRPTVRINTRSAALDLEKMMDYRFKQLITHIHWPSQNIDATSPEEISILVNKMDDQGLRSSLMAFINDELSAGWDTTVGFKCAKCEEVSELPLPLASGGFFFPKKRKI